VSDQGLKAGIAYVNANGGVLGGRKLSLTILDSAGNPTQSALLARKLLGENVTAIVGDLGSDEVLAQAPVMASASKPVIWFPLGSIDSLFQSSQYPYTFTTGYTSTRISQSYIDYLVKTRGFTKIGIIYENSAYGISSRDPAVADLKADGITPYEQEFSPTATDVTLQLRKLQSDGSQALMLLTFEGLPTVLKDLSLIGWHPPSVTAVGIAQSSTGSAAGPGGLVNVYGGPIGYRLTVTSSSAKPTGMTAEFLKYLTQVTGQTNFAGNQLNAANNFDEVVVLAAAINQAKSLDASAIRSALESGQAFSGSQGTFVFSASDRIGLSTSQYTLFQAATQCAQVCLRAPTS
jgi:branched-chain amino acid transport system substrate-binding protein